MKKIVLSDNKEVSLREPKVRDILALDNVEGEKLKEITLISNLSGISIGEIEEMNIKDYKLLAKGLEDFLS